MILIARFIRFRTARRLSTPEKRVEPMNVDMVVVDVFVPLSSSPDALALPKDLVGGHALKQADFDKQTFMTDKVELGDVEEDADKSKESESKENSKEASSKKGSGGAKAAASEAKKAAASEAKKAAASQKEKKSDKKAKEASAEKGTTGGRGGKKAAAGKKAEGKVDAATVAEQLKIAEELAEQLSADNDKAVSAPMKKTSMKKPNKAEGFEEKARTPLPEGWGGPSAWLDMAGPKKYEKPKAKRKAGAAAKAEDVGAKKQDHGKDAKVPTTDQHFSISTDVR